jgi:hypothetical protein
MEDTDNLQRVALGIIHDDVIRKGLDCPKPNWKLGYVLSFATAYRPFGQEAASFIDCIFQPIGRSNIIPCDITPNLEEVIGGLRRE